MKLTLCGSARFEKQFRQLDRELTLGGHTVYGLAVYPSEAGGKDWYTKDQKQRLDEAHLEKIDNSEGIIVLNYGAYIGESTRREIAHAISTDKARFYISIVPEFDVDGKRLCPFRYCRDRGTLNSPPCVVCYE